jgi:hypothetical protein
MFVHTFGVCSYGQAVSGACDDPSLGVGTRLLICRPYVHEAQVRGGLDSSFCRIEQPSKSMSAMWWLELP